MTKKIKTIKGSGGGGQKQHTPVEAPNTLRVRTIARVLFLLSEGEIAGLADQTNRLKSVYFSNTPVMNNDGTTNFNDVFLPLENERYGTPSQKFMKGYPSASSQYSVGVKITTIAPYTYTSTTSNIDAMRVTIRFPALYQQEENGDTNGSTVQFLIYKRLGAGAFALDRTITKTEKAISAADQDYLIDRPTGAGTWSVKVERVTADNSTSTKANDIYFQAVTEIQYAQLEYLNSAYLGLTVNAETTGSQWPTVGFDIKGILVKIPSNYNPVTRVYTGVWNGVFSTVNQLTDNPAWILYDLLTNTRYGMSINPADIDQYSFYDAAFYNDGLVPALVGGGVSGTEPRFTFNYQFMEQTDPWSMIQNVASTFGAVVYTSGNRVKLVQDRPTNYSRIITNSNVMDGMFDYTSSTDLSRNSAAVVNWNNPFENFLSMPCYYEDVAATAVYGLNVKEITGIGITTEGQAMRLAKWIVDTSINTTEVVSFKVGFSNAGIDPGEVLKIMDTHYAESMQEAKVLSSTTTTVTLDRAVVVASGNTFDVVGADGVTLYTRNITSTGTLSTITFTGATISVLPGADLVITGAISPRFFKVTSVKEESQGVYIISAVQYDPNKFGRVDNTPTGATPVYQALPSMTVVSPVTNFVFTEESYVDANNITKRNLVVKWTPPINQFVTEYQVFWNKNDANVIDLGITSQPNCRVMIDADGVYNFTVYAINSRGVKSAPATGSYSVNLSTPPGASPLLPVTGLQMKTGGTTFSGTDCNVVWTDPNTNGTAVVDGYEIKVKDASTPSTVYRTELVDVKAYTYDLTKQQTDNGANLKRTFIISVRVKDTWGRFSTATEVTFTNPAPAVPGGISVVSGTSSIKIVYTLPTDPDYKGTIIWRGNATGFTPDASNVLYDGSDSYISDAVPANTTYYYRLASYDVFGKSLSGTGMNISSEYNSSAIGVTSEDITGNISGTKITDGTILASKIAVIGQGAALNPDPNFQDSSAWYDYLNGSPGGDLYYNSTGVLLEFNGANTTTTLVDQSSVAATITSTGVTNSTTQIKYGAASGNFNGSSRASIPNNTKLAAVGDFTAEMWVRPTGTGTGIIWTHGAGTGNAYPWQIWINATGKIAARGYNNAGTPALAFDLASTATVTAATWFHVALVRSGNNFTLYKDGVSVATSSSSAVLFPTTSAQTLGAYDNGTTAFTGFMDDVRFTKGVARYTAAFTPPTASLPTFSTSGTATFVTITDGYVGTTALRSAATTSWYNGAQKIALDATKTYRVRAVARRNATADGTFYLGVALFDAAGANIGGDGVQWYYVVPFNAVANTAWTIYTGVFGNGTSKAFPANARTMVPLIVLNSGGTTGYMEAQDCRIEEQVPASLMVDGTITATKIAAGTITGDRIAGNTITGDRIAGQTITANNITSGTITATQISTNTITASNMVTGVMQADNTLTRGLTVRDNAGNIILSAGVPIGDTYLESGSGSNLQYNSDFSAALDGWTYGGNSGGATPGQTGVNLDPSWTLAPGTGSGTAVFWTTQGGTVNNSAAYYIHIGKQIPVQSGKRYIVSAYTGAHRCKVAVMFYEYDNAGTLVGNSPMAATCFNNAEQAGGTNLSGYKRVWDYKTTAANTAYIRVLLIKYDTFAGQTNSYMFVAQVMLEGAGANSVMPSSWTPAGFIDDTAVRATKQITTANASTYIASAAIGSAQIGTINANQVSAANLSAITANIGLLRTASSGGRMEIADNVLRVYDTGGVLRVKLGNLDL